MSPDMLRTLITAGVAVVVAYFGFRISAATFAEQLEPGRGDRGDDRRQPGTRPGPWPGGGSGQRVARGGAGGSSELLMLLISPALSVALQPRRPVTA